MAIESLVQLLCIRTADDPGRTLLRFHRDGAWRDWSYGEVLGRVEAIAGGLEVLGVRTGDRAAILSGARPEWLLAELGGMAAGAVMLGIDAGLPAEEAACILDHVEARIAILEDRHQAVRLAEVRHRVPQLEHVVLLEGEAPDDLGLLSLAALESLAAPGRGAERLRHAARRPREAPALICHTGGTTGVPKGAILTHGNVFGTLEGLAGAFGAALDGIDTVLGAVPPCHALGRLCAQFGTIFLGRTLALARGAGTMLDDAAALRPDAVVAAPRMLERLRDCLRDDPACDRLGGRLSFVFCGGEPLSPDVASFFENAGIRACEGWGLAETAGPVAVNRPGESRPGSAGRPLPGIELRVAGDGELLVHGPGVFAGYVDDPDRSEEAFDENGFLRTGDVGHIDGDGYVYVTGRKKELILTADGRPVAPQKLEQLLRERPFIANALAYGHGRPFVVAVLTIDRDAVAAWHPELADHPVGDPALLALVEEEVRRVNDRLPQPERIRAFRLLEGGGRDAIAPLRRLRRREAESRFLPLLEALYAAEQVASRPS